LAGLVLAELGLSKSRVRELQEIRVDRLSWAAAEAMKNMPSQRSSIRQIYGEDNWGPTVDGGVLPRHPFDPGAPEMSADVPLLTGSNLHEFVNGLDRREGCAMQVDELYRLMGQEFGERSQRNHRCIRTQLSSSNSVRFVCHHRSIFCSSSGVGAGKQKGCFGQGTSLLLHQPTPIDMRGALRF
jgi:carboxylesterase type B